MSNQNCDRMETLQWTGDVNDTAVKNNNPFSVSVKQTNVHKEDKAKVNQELEG